MNDIKQYTNRNRKTLMDKINDLSCTEHNEIFKIVIDHSSSLSYTKNTYGVFFNMRNFDDNLLFKIESFVSFCIENNKELEEYDKKLKECKMHTLSDQNIDQDSNYTSSSLLHLKDNIYVDAAIDSKIEEWCQTINNDPNVVKVINCLYNTDKTLKKNIHAKYHAAKKRYSRRIPYEKCSYFDVLNQLSKDM